MENCPNCKAPKLFTSSNGKLTRCTNCGKDVERKVSPSSINSLKKGKVILCTVHGRTTMEGVDAQLLAVGKPKGRTYYQWWEHTPGLAPSRELITHTKEHNHSKGRLDGWFERYTESLLDEWVNRGDSQHALVELLKKLNKGLNVAVSCYCHPEKRPVCHLTILRELLEDMGYVVEEAEPIDYK